ncbi:MAG: ABC transporter substrate-binding protein [Proteobacteria bacterium]|nr:ABC transporter substrate-binding protein [Pseudomonadota bacterium]
MKKLTPSIVAWLVIVLALVLVLPACEKKDKETYKIGAVFSVTGRASFLGDPEKKTAEMLVEQINKKGGVNGHLLELIVMDTEGDATKANLHVKKLMTKDKVLAVIGPSTSGNSMAVGPLAKQNQTPLISCAANQYITINKETGKTYEWVFKTPQTDAMAVETIYTHLQSKSINRIAIMSVTSGFGNGGRTELLKLASKYGMEILADEKYGTKDTDMTVQLTKIKSLKPQAIVNWSIGPTQVTVVRNWKALGMDNIPFYQSHGFGSLKNIKLSAGAAEGIYLPLGAVNIATILPDNHPQKEVTLQYLNDYKSKYNENLSSFGGHAWDAVNMVVKALEKAGADRAKIRTELENIRNFTGQHGVFNMSADDHNGLDKTSFNMLVVKNGTWALAD